MQIVDVRIICKKNSELEAEQYGMEIQDYYLLGLCANHLIAGATCRETKTALWHGGSLQIETGYVIEGYTLPDRISKIEKYLEGKDIEIMACHMFDTESDKFIRWINNHI